MDLTNTILLMLMPVVTKDLPISPRFTPYNFYRDANQAILQLVNQWFEFYLLTLLRYPRYGRKNTNSAGKNRTHNFRTSRCAGYRKYRSLGTPPRLTFQARLLHNQVDVNTDRHVQRKLSTRSFQNCPFRHWHPLGCGAIEHGKSV